MTLNSKYWVEPVLYLLQVNWSRWYDGFNFSLFVLMGDDSLQLQSCNHLRDNDLGAPSLCGFPYRRQHLIIQTVHVYVFISLVTDPINYMAYVDWAASYHLKRSRDAGRLNYLTLWFPFSILRLRHNHVPGVAGEDFLGFTLAPGGWLNILKRDDHYPSFLRKQTKGHWCKTSPPNNSIGGSVSLTFPLSVKHISFLLCLSYLGEFFSPKRSMNRC